MKHKPLQGTHQSTVLLGNFFYGYCLFRHGGCKLKLIQTPAMQARKDCSPQETPKDYFLQNPVVGELPVDVLTVGGRTPCFTLPRYLLMGGSCPEFSSEI